MYPRATLDAFAASLPESSEKQLFLGALQNIQSSARNGIELVLSGDLMRELQGTPAELFLNQLEQDWMAYTKPEDILSVVQASQQTVLEKSPNFSKPKPE